MNTKIVLKTISYLLIALIVLFFFFAIFPGLKYFSVEFFTKAPSNAMTSGGIFPAIYGTLIISVLALGISIPLGILLGVALYEYNLKYIKYAVTILSGIPSVVYGMFGLALFSITMGFRTSIISGALTLALLVLPVIASAVYEVVAAIPREIRESAYALGARKTEVIFDMVLPSNKKSILTVSLVASGRALGETAPLILTAAVFYSTKLPTSIFSPTMTLPTHIYFLSAAYGQSARWMVQGATSVLTIFVVLVYSIAFSLRRSK